MEKLEIKNIEVLISKKKKINSKFFHKDNNSLLITFSILTIIEIIVLLYYFKNELSFKEITFIILLSSVSMLPYIFFIYPYVELPIKFNKSMGGMETFKDFYNGKQKIDIKINSLYKNDVELNNFIREENIETLKKELNKIKENKRKKTLSELILENKLFLFWITILSSLINSFFDINELKDDIEIQNRIWIRIGICVAIIIVIIISTFIVKRIFYDYNYDDEINVLNEIYEYLESKKNEISQITQIFKDKESYSNKNIQNFTKDDKWDVFDIKKSKDLEKIKTKNNLRSIFIIFLLRCAIILLVVLTFYIIKNFIENSKQELSVSSLKKYILNNSTDKDIEIELDTTGYRYTLGLSSSKKITLKEGEHSIKKNDGTKCQFTVNSDSEIGIIDLKSCGVVNQQSQFKSFPKEYDYILTNLSDREISIDLYSDKDKFYKLEPNTLRKVTLKEGRYNLTKNCKLNVEFNSKDGIVTFIDSDKCEKSYY